MTENQNSSQPDPAVRWWEQPGAGVDPARADPTVIGAPQDAFQGIPQPPQQAPQPYTPQQPYPAQPFGSVQQPPSAPQYPAAPQFAPQPFAPGYGPPPAPYGQYPPGPPRRSGSKAPWVVVGIVGLVVAVAVAVGIFALADSAGGDDKSQGDYAMGDVTNACDLVDVTVLNRWAPTVDSNEHTENKPTGNYGGGSLNCRARNKGTGINDAALTMDADFATKYTGTYSYQIWKDIDTATSGTGRSSGTVAGLGEEAYFAARADDSSNYHSLDYTVAARDSNISVKVEIRVSAKTAVDRSAVAAACETQVRKVLTGLRK